MSASRTYKRSDGYALVDLEYEHRVVMEKHIGRELLPEEVVHHINRNRLDNRIENLMLLPNNAAHAKQHLIEDAKIAGYDLEIHNWCSYHQCYHLKAAFGKDRAQWSGLTNSCKEGRKTYVRK